VSQSRRDYLHSWLNYCITVATVLIIFVQVYSHCIISHSFSMQEPQKLVLGRYHKKVRKGSKLVDVEKEDTAYYVPILQSIQQLLNDDSVLEEVRIVYGVYIIIIFVFILMDSSIFASVMNL
jgi:hypothetical protein